MNEKEENDEFYTLKGYQSLEKGGITNAMEDYLEMIARLQKSGERVRINTLARRLNVKAPSATKMVHHLSQCGFLTAPKYGDISLTEKGAAKGEYLLYRHEVLTAFLCFLNGSDNELEQAEKIEHFLNENTVKNLEKLLNRLKSE